MSAAGQRWWTVVATVALAVPSFVQAARASGDVVSLGKSYTLSRSADYVHTRDDGDATQLTDGRLAADTIWLQRDAVAWHADGFPISIEIDLEAVTQIGSVCVRSARRESAGVAFPARIDVFVSDDKQTYAWLGAMRPFAEAGAGAYLARDFCLSQLADVGRFVRLEVTTQGRYFVTDEIAVRARADGGARHMRAADALVAADDVRAFVQTHKALGFMAADLQVRLGTMGGRRDLSARLTEVIWRLDGGDTAPVGRLALGAFEAEIKDIARASWEALPDGIEARRVDPWPQIGPLGTASAKPFVEVVTIPAGGHGAAVVELRHDRNQPVTFTVAAAMRGAIAGGVNSRLFEIGLITRADGHRHGDPLLPLTQNQIEVLPATVVQLWIDLAAAPLPKAAGGRVVVDVTAKFGDATVTRQVSIPVEVKPLPVRAIKPAAVCWGYLSDRAYRGQETAAVADMVAHGIDTAVLPGAQIPWPKPDATPTSDEIGDYTAFDAVMTKLAGHKRFVFYLAPQTSTKHPLFRGRFDVEDPKARALLSAWIKEWSFRLRRAGYGDDQIAFYPVDEPSSERRRADFVAMARLIRAADPARKIFLTLHVPEMVNDDLIDATDIVVLNGAAVAPDLIARFRAHGKQIWSYATDGGGKAGDPATFYRREAWTAAKLGLTGIGFWSCGDSGPTGTAWNDLDGLRPDFAVVYDRPGGFVGSKRWEVWREGYQDLQLVDAARRSARGAAARQDVEALISQALNGLAEPEVLERVRRALFIRALDAK